MSKGRKLAGAFSALASNNSMRVVETSAKESVAIPSNASPSSPSESVKSQEVTNSTTVKKKKKQFLPWKKNTSKLFKKGSSIVKSGSGLFRSSQPSEVAEDGDNKINRKQDITKKPRDDPSKKYRKNKQDKKKTNPKEKQNIHKRDSGSKYSLNSSLKLNRTSLQPPSVRPPKKPHESRLSVPSNSLLATSTNTTNPEFSVRSDTPRSDESVVPVEKVEVPTIVVSNKVSLPSLSLATPQAQSMKQLVAYLRRTDNVIEKLLQEANDDLANLMRGILKVLLIIR